MDCADALDRYRQEQTGIAFSLIIASCGSGCGWRTAPRIVAAGYRPVFRYLPCSYGSLTRILRASIRSRRRPAIQAVFPPPRPMTSHDLARALTINAIASPEDGPSRSLRRSSTWLCVLSPYLSCPSRGSGPISRRTLLLPGVLPDVTMALQPWRYDRMVLFAAGEVDALVPCSSWQDLSRLMETPVAFCCRVARLRRACACCRRLSVLLAASDALEVLRDYLRRISVSSAA